jgi:hypothetical protein
MEVYIKLLYIIFLDANPRAETRSAYDLGDIIYMAS